MSDIIVLASVAPVAVASAAPVAAQIGAQIGGIVAQHANEIASVGVAVVLVVVDGLVERFVTRIPWLRMAWQIVRGRAADAATKATANGLRKLDGGRHD